MMTQGTLVDATIIEAPSSTKNKEQQRDPEMHQTKKGNQWHFGMKAHIGVDAKSGLTHSLVTTAVTSMTSISWVICCMERSNLSQPMPATKGRHSARSWYRGGCGLADRRAPRQGKNLETASTQEQNGTINIEYMKASIRAKVEHPFRIIKRQFGFVKARYKGLLKNDNQLAMLFTLVTCFGRTK
ncbi:transposase [Escherichia coli]|uniref:transposase n=1 Tax=Escherichia coli TaxID=562 RepID=UPI001F4C7BCB|nr:transposase [Escherichia coli]UNF04875.1 transposase [Escherichia coli]